MYELSRCPIFSSKLEYTAVICTSKVQQIAPENGAWKTILSYREGKLFNRGGKIVPISTCDVYAKYRYVSIFLQMCVKTDMQRHVFLWSRYLYWVCTYAYIYICTWYWYTQCKSKQYTVYTHMYILYKYTYIYIYCLWLYYNTPPMITQAPWLVHGQHDHGPETATAVGAPTSTSSKEDTAVQRPCCKMLTWAGGNQNFR